MFNEAIRRGDLAEQVLKEVPTQLVSFMEMNGVPAVAIQQDFQQVQ